MSKVITFSRTYPSYHPRAGEPTYFVEKMLKSLEPESKTWNPPYAQLLKNGLSLFVGDLIEPKHHTIRAGHRWKEGDWFSPRVWSGKPYNSKQIQFAPDIQIKKVWDFDISGHDGKFFIDGKTLAECHIFLIDIAENDGLTAADFRAWFKHPKPFSGQIICWSDTINY